MTDGYLPSFFYVHRLHFSKLLKNANDGELNKKCQNIEKGQMRQAL